MMLKYIGCRLIQWLSTQASDESVFRMVERLGDWQCRSAPSLRRNVTHNLSLILGQTLPERSVLVGEVFQNFTRYLAEFFSIHQRTDLKVHAEGEHYLRQAQHQGRGAIILTAHLGNWEAGAVAIRRMGFPLAVVALAHPDRRLDALFNSQRQRCGLAVIPLGPDAGRESLRQLRNGRFLGMLGDWVFSGPGVSESFCGVEHLFPLGPVLLSLRANVPVVPAFLIREGLWTFRLCIDPPIWPQIKSSRQTAIRQMMQGYVKSFERHLKQVPTQWLMFQRFHCP